MSPRHIEFEYAEDTRPRPFDHTQVRRLSRSDADSEFPELVKVASMHGKDIEPAPKLVTRHLGLSPQARFIEAPYLRQPIVFSARIEDKPCHVVAAREYGDVAWPAWLAEQREEARRDLIRTMRAFRAYVAAAFQPTTQEVNDDAA